VKAGDMVRIRSLINLLREVRVEQPVRTAFKDIPALTRVFRRVLNSL
jgi:hypothetical protein